MVLLVVGVCMLGHHFGLKAVEERPGPPGEAIETPVNLKVDKDYPILVFGGGYLHAVSALDGEVLWKKDFTAEGFEVRRVLQPPGSSSIIYVLGFLHSSEAIVCIRLIPKVERWWHRKARCSLTQAIVSPEQDLLYKYVSINLLFVATGSVTPEESALVVYLIDTITGRTLHRLTHQGCQGPVHALFSESWVVNDYFNLRANKYEVTVVEIYDQSRASEVLTKSQSYFFPQTIAVTSTAKGITSKQLLIGTIGDQILALDKRFVNPRRTLNPSQAEKESSLSRIHYPSFLRFTHTHVIRHTLPQGRRSKKHSNSSGQARVNNTRLCLWSGSLLHKDLLLQRPTIRSPMISATHFS
ncbi:hypothetical protein Bca101_016197 [Brassica carinata]